MDVLELLEEIDRLDEPYYKGYICKYDVQDIIRNHFLDVRKMVDNWIPVEEGLPEEHPGKTRVTKIFQDKRYKECWHNIKSLHKNASDKVLVTLEINGETTIDFDRTVDGKWEIERMYNGLLNEKVTAWQPLPEPYGLEESKPAKNTQQEMEDFWRDK